MRSSVSPFTAYCSPDMDRTGADAITAPLLSRLGSLVSTWGANSALGCSAGVRSLAFRDHLLSSGSGHGKLSFFDLRANAYLQMESPEGPSEPPRDNFKIGAGWLKEDHIYR